MSTLQQQLLDFKQVFETSKNGYELAPPSLFMDEYKKANTTYISPCAAIIMRENSLPDNMLDLVETCVYLANQVSYKEKEQALDAELAADGWVKITASNYKDIPKTGRALLRKDSTDDLFGAVSNLKCRLVEHEGVAFFVPPRKRNRGYSAASLAVVSKCHYKMVA